MNQYLTILTKTGLNYLRIIGYIVDICIVYAIGHQH